MADPRFNHPDFGTREEDWPDLDIDSGDEEYHSKRELADAALAASIKRSIRQRHQQPEYTHIPHDLYAKAANHQDQLTQNERTLLLSRGDMIGKVLGYPDLLTPEEMHAFLLWAPPDIARANIQRVTDGSLSTPTELYAKAKEAIDRGDLETSLSEEAIKLPARRFYALDDPNCDGSATMTAIYVPGYKKATELLHKRLGLDPIVLQASAIHTLKRNFRDAGKEVASVARPRPVHEPLISQSDVFGLKPWPPTSLPVSAFALFKQESSLSSLEVHDAWINLTEAEKEVYRTQHEKLRIVAWEKHEAANCQAAEPQLTPIALESVVQPALSSLQQRLAELPNVVTGLQVFRNELDPNMSFEKAVQQWDKLTEMQKDAHDAKAAALYKAAKAEYAERRKNYAG